MTYNRWPLSRNLSYIQNLVRILCLFACSVSLSLSLSSLSHCYKLILRLSFLSIPVFEKSDKSIGNAFCFFLFFSLSLSLSHAFSFFHFLENHTLSTFSRYFFSLIHMHMPFSITGK